MSPIYHTAIPSSPKQPGNAATVNTPLNQLDTYMGLMCGGGVAPDNFLYANWEAAVDRHSGNPTYDVTYTDVIKTVNIIWPDNSSGVYTAVTIDATWIEVTEFTVTHVLSGKTLTGSGLVRNAAGQITTRMTLSVA